MESSNPYIPSKATSKAPGAGKKAVVAMSGGVDSSVAAAILKQQGFEVVGIALQTTDYSKYRNDETGGTCCSIKDMEDARRVAEHLDSPFYVLDTEKTFDANVVDYFVGEYMQGRTPNPCIMCNTKVKFNHLYRRAMDLGADYVVTGHYAKVSQEPGIGYALWRSRDEAKDQTYFLFNLTQAQLAKTLFPLGGFLKSEVRKIAEEMGIPTAVKPDSQEICFVPGNQYAKFIESRTSPERRPAGKVMTSKGVLLGEHQGVFRFTIGQRKGLGDYLNKAKSLNVPGADELHVVKLDAIRGNVILGTEAELQQWGLVATDVNWIGIPDLRNARRVQVRIRSRHEPIDAEIRLLGDNRVQVLFTEAQRAVTPGQACVFYEGNRCLGGGWIAEAIQVAEQERPKKHVDGPMRL